MTAETVTKFLQFDDVLKQIGEFGWYQKRMYFLLCLTSLACGIHAFLPVFAVAIPKFRCSLKDYSNDTYKIHSSYHATLIRQNIPLDARDSKAGYLKCKLRNQTSMLNETITCQSWVYDKSVMRESTVSEMNLVCVNKVRRSHMKMVYMAGKLIGSFVLGALADYLGRKKILLFSCVLQFISGLANAFVPDYITFSVCRFFNGAASSGIFVSAFVIGMEIVGPSKRMWTGMVIEIFFALGGVILVLVAYLIREWRTIQIVVSSPSALFILYWWLMPESPRWLINRGRVHEATKILNTICETNKAELPGKLDLMDDRKNAPKVRLWELFSTTTLACRTSIIFLNWAVVSGVYYGLSLNSGELYHDMYLSFSLNILVELASYIFCMFLLDRIGRKWLHTSMMLLGGLANLCTIFPVLYGDAEVEWVTMALALLGKMGASAAFAVIYIFTSELYPTILRNSAVGASSTAARVGGVLSPYIADLGHLMKTDFGKALPLVIFGASSVVAGLLALRLPETLNKTLPDTILEADTFGKKENAKGGKLFPSAKVNPSKGKDDIEVTRL